MTTYKLRPGATQHLIDSTGATSLRELAYLIGIEPERVENAHNGGTIREDEIWIMTSHAIDPGFPLRWVIPPYKG